jgi:hypothetical protein
LTKPVFGLLPPKLIFGVFFRQISPENSLVPVEENQRENGKNRGKFGEIDKKRSGEAKSENA